MIPGPNNPVTSHCKFTGGAVVVGAGGASSALPLAAQSVTTQTFAFQNTYQTNKGVFSKFPYLFNSTFIGTPPDLDETIIPPVGTP